MGFVEGQGGEGPNVWVIRYQICWGEDVSEAVAVYRKRVRAVRYDEGMASDLTSRLLFCNWLCRLRLRGCIYLALLAVLVCHHRALARQKACGSG